MKTLSIPILIMLFAGVVFSSDSLKTYHTGPRIGVIYFSADSIGSVKINPVSTLFGWHFEHRFPGGENRINGVVEFIPMVAGFESGKFFPTLSMLIGVRFPNRFHFGAGPNVTVVSTSVVIAAGYNHQSGPLSIPFDFAIALHKQDFRLSFSTGFNLPE